VRVGVSDAGPSGRARLEAVARWLQDVAYADVLDAGLQDGLWVVRRMRVEVTRLPVLGDRVRLRTWCSAIGQRTAERRTTVEGDRDAAIAAVAVWAHLDPATGAPGRLGERFAEVYGPSAGPGRPDHRLRHPPPPAEAARRPWTFRAADVDVAGHVNNAVYWEALEERPAPVEPFAVEAEHRAPAVAGPALLAHEAAFTWVTSPEGEVHASFEVQVT
jgi:acyl-ACP thioesterase